jgi:hypothetical protein
LAELCGVKLAPLALITALSTALAAALALVIIILGLSRKAQPGGHSRD